MSQKYRLSRTDFKLMRGFRRLSGRFFSLSFGLIAGRSSSGVAVVVSKKVAAHATDRNRVKRRARAVLADYVLDRDPVFVLIAKKAAASAAFDDVRTDIQNLVAQARGAR